MALITYYDKRFETPEPKDPANIALQLQRLAEQYDAPLDLLQDWTAFLTDGSSGDEVGVPAVHKTTLGPQTGYQPNIEKSVLWDVTLFDNTSGPAGVNDLFLPDQDQRYWWWMGCNLLVAPITDNARMAARIYIQDRDPATGQVLTTVSRYNHYMRTEGDQYMAWDGFFRTGGGRQRVTFGHGGAAATSILAGSSVWALRICPDR